MPKTTAFVTGNDGISGIQVSGSEMAIEFSTGRSQRFNQNGSGRRTCRQKSFVNRTSCETGFSVTGNQSFPHGKKATQDVVDTR
jgi:hypothetical protein